ncbi:MAG: HD domain-containing protein [Ignavibacteriales bacterium]|nr:HD domain-containing protein [Ignavibacteriales bacterium]
MSVMEASVKKREEFRRMRKRVFEPSRSLADPTGPSVEFALWIEGAAREASKDISEGVAVVSTGSFARRELSPFSDIDVTFVAEDAEKASETIGRVLTGLWDGGVEASHTVRQLEDLPRVAAEDVASFTQLFESRFLAGDRELYDRWRVAILELLDPDTVVAAFENLQRETERRHKKYGGSPKIVEPNVKNSCGGLRDLQTAEWMHVLLQGEYFDDESGRAQIDVFVDRLRDRNDANHAELERLADAYRRLLGVRHVLHCAHNRRVDRFEFEDQKRYARLAGDDAEDGYRAAMKTYFAAATVVNRFYKTFVKRRKRHIYRTPPDSLSIQLDDAFGLIDDTIVYRKPAPLKPADVARAFFYRGENGAIFDERLREAVVETCAAASGPPSAAATAWFREILRLPANVGATLSMMNELGALSLLLPEFADLSGFIHNAVYHCYAADEHTVHAVENVEALGGDATELGEIFTRLPDRELLYVAVLLHDIAKPHGVEGHEILGAEMADSIMQRLGYTDREIETVAFLVANHFLMTRAAFHRNLNDPDTLDHFVETVETVERLELLYLLTYADLSAVNPALWTSWKHDLLKTLYAKARRMIEREIDGATLLGGGAERAESISRHSERVSESDAREHIELVDDGGYLAHFSEREVARHIEALNHGEAVELLFGETNEFTTVAVVANDTPRLLANLCGALTINDADIHDARIFTRKDGVAIDSFNVVDYPSGEKLGEERPPKIADDVRLAVADLLPLDDQMTRTRARWRRVENRKPAPTGETRVRFERANRFTIIDVFAPDRIGLLYRITETLARLEISVDYAKISTNGGEARDSFYVRNRERSPISPNYYPIVETELLEALRDIT